MSGVLQRQAIVYREEWLKENNLSAHTSVGIKDREPPGVCFAKLMLNSVGVVPTCDLSFTNSFPLLLSSMEKCPSRTSPNTMKGKKITNINKML